MSIRNRFLRLKFSTKSLDAALLWVSRKGKVRYLIMSTKLYVGNLSFETSSQDLEELFAGSGTVVSASVIDDRDTGRSRGFGFVEMSNAEEAKAAIEANDGKEVGGRSLKVMESKPREDNRGGGRGNSGGGGY